MRSHQGFDNSEKAVAEYLKGKNVAIAARTAVDERDAGHRERFAPQTAEEAERLAAYNRYLAGLNADSGSANR